MIDSSWGIVHSLPWLGSHRLRSLHLLMVVMIVLQDCFVYSLRRIALFQRARLFLLSLSTLHSKNAGKLMRDSYVCVIQLFVFVRFVSGLQLGHIHPVDVGAIILLCEFVE